MYDASFVQMASNLIKENKKKEAASVIDSGLEYFSKGLVEAITPYAAADAGLIVIVCRHLAQELERKKLGRKRTGRLAGRTYKKARNRGKTICADTENKGG